MLLHLIASVTLAATPAIAASQQPALDELNLLDPFRWVGFTTADGLPDDRVTLVVEADDGTTWASTHAGVAWYDGYRWHPALDLPKAKVHDISGDLNGRVVVIVQGEAWGGGRAGFERLPIASQPYGCEAVPEGGVLVFTIEEGPVYRSFLVDEDVRETAAVPGLEVMGDPGQGFVAAADGEGPWFCTRGSLFRWKAGQWVREAEHEAEAFTAFAMQRPGAGVAYVVHPTEQRGLWQWRAGTFEPVELRPGLVSRQIAVGPEGNAIAVLGMGEIWIRERGEWQVLDHLPRRLRGCNVLTFRANGDLWVAGDAGLHLYRAHHPYLEFWEHEVDGVPAMPLEYLEASDDSIWIGTTGGVERRGPENSLVVFDSIGDTDLHTITGLAEDLEGNVWISSGSGDVPGAWRWDGESWSHFGAEQGLPATAIHKIRRDRSGRLWFLAISTPSEETPANPGAYVLEGGGFEAWTANRGVKTKAAYAFAESRDGTYWFGTREGVRRWRGGRWEHWSREEPGGVRGRVFTLALDDMDRPWFGHQTVPGVGTIDADGAVRYVAEAFDGNPGGVSGIHCDRLGRLWLGTHAGLRARIDGRWVGIGVGEGLPDDNILELLPVSGRLLLGTWSTSVLNLRAALAHPPVAHIEADPLGEYAGLQRWSVDTWWGTVSGEKVPTRFRFDDGPWSPWSLRRHAPAPELSSGEHAFTVQTQSILNSEVGSVRQHLFQVQRPGSASPLVPMALVALGFTVVTGLILLIARRRAERRVLTISEHRYRSLVESVPVAMFIRKRGCILFANPAAARLMGAASTAELIGADVMQFVHPDSRENVRERVATDGLMDEEAHWVAEKLVRLDGEVIQAEVTASSVEFDGEPATQVLARDVSELHRHRERQELMTRELDHRVKNTLAGVLAIAQQSMDTARGFDDFQESFTGRVRAMARAHEALAASRWRGVSAKEILELVISPFTMTWSGLLEVEGPPLLIRAQAATPLAMALHELVTNGTKYGTLGVPHGKLRIEIAVRDSEVCITWLERGGPPVGTQPRSGVGLTLIRGMIEYELGGSVDFEFADEGLTCEFRVPSQNLLLKPATRRAPSRTTRPTRDRVSG